MLLISLRHCSVTHNVGEHYCSESALAFCQLDLPNLQISLSITFAKKRHQAMKSFAWLKSCAHTRTPSNNGSWCERRLSLSHYVQDYHDPNGDHLRGARTNHSSSDEDIGSL